MKLYIQAITALSRIQDKERGATMAEYGLMLGLIAAICIGAVTTLGGSIQTMFNAVNAAITAN